MAPEQVALRNLTIVLSLGEVKGRATRDYPACHQAPFQRSERVKGMASETMASETMASETMASETMASETMSGHVEARPRAVLAVQ